MSDDVKERLSKAREAKEKRDAEKKAAAEARELELLEIEEKLEAMYGPRGVYFELLDTLEGPVAVKLGEAVLHTKFSSLDPEKINESSIHDYVFPCVVHPTKDKYVEMIGRRPAIGMRCANALATLFGMKDKADSGKF